VHVHDRDECVAAQEHWAEHGFGTWAILVRAGTFAGVAEVHYAHPGVVGISTDEIEVGWSILPDFQGRGFATEAARAAILDAWTRTGVDHVVAYVSPDNVASHRVAEKLGFTARGEGRTRSGDPMTVYELRAA
jgi:RimJ/RimL family protein N-acetyltransferase